jgi:hypothetical protein
VSVTERLMQAGSWELALKSGTPQAVRDTLDFFGHVFVFDSPMRAGLGDATMIATSRWGGVVRTRSTPWHVGGANMIVWLGDEDGKGPILETNIGGGGNTFAQYMTAILLQCVAIQAGSAVAVAGTRTTAYGIASTARQAIDHLCSSFNAEYRVNKNWTIDTAPVGSASLFQLVPTAIAAWKSSGRDQNITGIVTTTLDVSTDAEEYITRAIVHDKTGAYTGHTGSAGPYKDGFGNALVMKKMFEESLTTAADAAAHATNLVAAGQVLRHAVSISTNEFDINRDVQVGDNIYVYRPDSSMVDLANQVRYRGGVIYPTILRVLASTWPIEKGMSVWYRDSAGAWTDLTDHVAFEDAGASFEVGAASRPLTHS